MLAQGVEGAGRGVEWECGPKHARMWLRRLRRPGRARRSRAQENQWKNISPARLEGESSSSIVWRRTDHLAIIARVLFQRMACPTEGVEYLFKRAARYLASHPVDLCWGVFAGRLRNRSDFGLTAIGSGM